MADHFLDEVPPDEALMEATKKCISILFTMPNNSCQKILEAAGLVVLNILAEIRWEQHGTDQATILNEFISELRNGLDRVDEYKAGTIHGLT